MGQRRLMMQNLSTKDLWLVQFGHFDWQGGWVSRKG